MTKKCVLVALLGAAILLAVLLASGAFDRDPIEPGTFKAARRTLEPVRTVQATLTVVPEMYEAVGTVRPKVETRVEAQVRAKVLQVLVREGDKVDEGQKLIVLEAREISSRVEQAEESLNAALAAKEQAREQVSAARAGLAKAKATFQRMQEVFKRDVIPREQLEQSETEYLQAQARLNQALEGMNAAQAKVNRARKGLEEAHISLDYATITSPTNGEVAKRDVEPGDLAFPGKPLLHIQTTGKLRLEANVREGVVSRVRPGEKLPVVIAAMGERTLGVVEEVTPSADPSTRTFLVKVGLPEIPGLYPGMFGRLMVPLDQKAVVLVDSEAVTRVGQLETVLVAEVGGNATDWQMVYVKTGQDRDGQVEVLSGLSGNETLGIGGRL